MECLGEPDYDYWFFAGITGDNFTQHYPVDKSHANNDATSSYFLENNGTSYVESVFEKCGYASSYVLGKDLNKNKEMYLQTLIGYTAALNSLLFSSSAIRSRSLGSTPHALISSICR